MNFLIWPVFTLAAITWLDQVAGAPTTRVGTLPNGSKFVVKRRTDGMQHGKCMSAVIIGDPAGVSETILYDCVEDKDSLSVTRNDLIIVDGVIYTDKNDTVIVRQGEDCKLHKYTSEISVTDLTGKMCDDVKAAMKNKLSVQDMKAGVKPSASGGPKKQNIIMRILSWLWNLIMNILEKLGIKVSKNMRNLFSQSGGGILSKVAKVEESKPSTQPPKQS